MGVKMTIVEVVKIEVGGIVHLPPGLLKFAGFEPGEEVEARPEAGKLVLKKKGSITEKLRGRLKLDQEVAEEVIFAPELEYEAF
jgi:bifunctional DNA-binding transcriptional regulator/antitoxin component of YhaV-PrlF toxin-antitoxin module